MIYNSIGYLLKTKNQAKKKNGYDSLKYIRTNWLELIARFIRPLILVRGIAAILLDRT